MLLPVGICDGSTEVAAAVAWSQMVVNYSSMLMQAEAEKARRPCRLRWTTRPDLTHGKFVADHGPWCHVRGHNAPRLGTQSIPASANRNGAAKA